MNIKQKCGKNKTVKNEEGEEDREEKHKVRCYHEQQLK